MRKLMHIFLLFPFLGSSQFIINSYAYPSGGGAGTLIYDEDFEALTDDARTGFDGWSNAAADDSDATDGATRQWRVDSGGTPTATTGPDDGSGGSTYYIYAETSGGNTANWYFRLDSATLNASTNTWYLQFDYHAYFNGDTTSGELKIFGWNGSSWVQIGTTITGEQQANNAAEYTQDLEYNSSSFSNTDFQFRIEFLKQATASVFNQDAALDNLRIWNGVPQ